MTEIQKRRKKKEKPKIFDKWKDVDVENVEDLDGFWGLEELHDYDDKDLEAIIGIPRKKKRKNEVDTEEDEKILEENLEKKEEVPVLKEEEPKKMGKKERRKEKRKQSFKLKLKERRRKFKEMKRMERSGNVTVVKQGVGEQKVEESGNVTVVKQVVGGQKVEEKEHVSQNDMSDWNGLGVREEILQALSDRQFLTPTPIQFESLRSAILHRQDIIGAAETGSGKTLAFGIPLIQHIMELKERRASYIEKLNENSNQNDGTTDQNYKPLCALIITPTRELAIQIHSHLMAVAKYTDIKCAAIVGGLALPKQERLMSKHPEIVVATPGRLYTMIKNGELHLSKLNHLKFLVIDECDRMLEHGHFKELDEILGMLSDTKRQTFLFSATLTLPQYRKNQSSDSDRSQLQILVNKLGLNTKAKLIDLTAKHVTASMLRQIKVMCTNEEKEIYLNYFLMSHPGRTIVFVNSIALSKKLFSLCSLLGCNPLHLHAGKQQRQRLKCLDRFQASETGLLIATDVAARGLDIPNVQNVVHFQLPVDPKVYIHRAGRTARAQQQGLSFILEGPEDFKSYQKISEVLKLGSEIPRLNIDRGFLDGIKARVTLAKQIDKEEYKARKESSDINWMERSAKSMDLEVDVSKTNVLTKKQKLILHKKRKELQNLLNTKLISKGFSGSYPTRSGKLIVPGLQPMK